MAPTIVYRYRLLPDRGCDDISPQVEGLSGYLPGAFQEAPALFFDIVHPQDRGNLMAMLAERRDSVRLRWIRADGSSVWVELSAAPVWAGGQMVAFEGEIKETEPPPGRCASYHPACVWLLEVRPED